MTPAPGASKYHHSRQWRYLKAHRGGAPRIGLFGLLGSGNIGNDGSLEAVLGYLRRNHPDAVLSALCGGPEAVRARYGIDATPLHWYRGEYRTAAGAGAVAGKAFGKLVDAARTASWVRRQDAVIVPGMGVLEATLPLRPWGTPYSLLLLCAAGRLFGTPVALVSVGSNVIGRRATRLLVRWAARLAGYRSYRDELSRTAMRTMGVDTAADRVYPDLAFALPVPLDVPAEPGTVGVGVMAFRGGNDDRPRAAEIAASYLDGMARFVAWLVSTGRRVRLFTGDEVDQPVVAEILARVGARPGGPNAAVVTAAPAASLDELMRQMAPVDAVVATRYHNVLCALKLGKPTLSVGYAAKNEALMADAGLAGFCHPAASIDADRLVAQFAELQARAPELRAGIQRRNEAAARQLQEQFAVLSAALFPAHQLAGQPAGQPADQLAGQPADQPATSGRP